MLKELAALDNKLASGQQLSAEELRKMTELQEQLKKFAKEAEQLAKDMHERAAQTQLYDLEQSYRDNLERLSKQLEKQGALAKQLGEQAARLRKDPAHRDQANAFRQSAMNLQKEQSPFDEPNQQQLKNGRRRRKNAIGQRADQPRRAAEIGDSAAVGIGRPHAQFRDRPTSARRISNACNDSPKSRSYCGRT